MTAMCFRRCDILDVATAFEVRSATHFEKYIANKGVVDVSSNDGARGLSLVPPIEFELVFDIGALVLERIDRKVIWKARVVFEEGLLGKGDNFRAIVPQGV